MAAIKVKPPAKVVKSPTAREVVAEHATKIKEAVSGGKEDVGARLARAKAAMASINKSFPGSKIILANQIPQVPRIRTGHLSIDVVTGGGFPRQRASQVKGPEHSGKTTVLFDMIARLQREGGIAAWVNGEEFDAGWAQSRGVDTDQLVLIPFADGTTMLEQLVQMMASGTIDLACLDSIQTVKPPRALDTPIGETGYGSGAPQMWNDLNGKINYLYAKGMADTAFVWVSQMRAKIATGWQPPGADKEDGSQVKALLHWKSIDVRYRPGGFLKVNKDSDPYGRGVVVKCEKNKVGPRPYREAEYDFIFGDGGPVPVGQIDRGKELVSHARFFNVIVSSGAHYSYGGKKIANGLENLHAFFRDPDNADLFSEIEEKVLEIAATSTA